MSNKVRHNGMMTLFATPVFLTEILDDNLLDNTIEEIIKLRDNNEGVQRYGSWVSPDNLHTLPQFQELTELLLSEAERALDTLTIKRDSHYITCMWSNIAPVGTAHPEHIHSNCLYSGVLYLKSPKGAATTIFSDPRPAVAVLEPDYENPNPAILGARWGTAGERGGLVIFPSWLPHGVETVPASDEERITLSFNIMIKSKISTHTQTVEFK